MSSKVKPCLWFDGTAEEAAKFYVTLLPGSRIEAIHRAPADYPAGKTGDVLTVEFTIGGQAFTALNGGPYFTFNEAVSLQIFSEDQAETDRLADVLSAVPEAEQCGWVKDRYGLSWQIIPRVLTEMLSDPDPVRSRRAMEAMLEMKRIDIAALKAAVEAEPG